MSDDVRDAGKIRRDAADASKILGVPCGAASKAVKGFLNKDKRKKLPENIVSKANKSRG